MRRACFALLAVGILLIPAVRVSAAGAMSASISGPGVDRPIELLDRVPNLPAIAGAWFAARAEDVRPLAADAPVSDLGPRYTLTWVMLGPPNLPPEERSVVQHVYPSAAGGPLVETPPGQGVWEGAVGWYRAPKELTDLLASAGAPPGSRSSGRGLTSVFAVAVAVLAALVPIGDIGSARRAP